MYWWWCINPCRVQGLGRRLLDDGRCPAGQRQELITLIITIMIMIMIIILMIMTIACWGLGCRLSGLGFRVQGLGLLLYNSKYNNDNDKTNNNNNQYQLLAHHKISFAKTLLVRLRPTSVLGFRISEGLTQAEC